MSSTTNSPDSTEPTAVAGTARARPRVGLSARLGGRYRLFDRIGGGGMADVYMADDDQLGVLVALKVLKPDIATAEMRQRMIQEARLAASIQHPNIVRVYCVESDGPTTYIVMELLRGASLEHYLQEQPDQRLPWDVAIRLLTPAMEVLHGIHQRGYVHRDIKPANLFVPAPGTRGEGAVVLDLGIVHRDPELRTDHAPPPTETGRVLGTPAYMSPEQAGAGGLDPRSDVYSFAVTLYRALVGRPPFVPEEGRGALLARHIYESPPSMRAAAPTARIPRAIAEVVHRALAKDPAERYPSMQAFAAALHEAARVSEARLSPRRVAPALGLGFAGGLAVGVTAALALVMHASSDPPAPTASAGASVAAAHARAPVAEPAPRAHTGAAAAPTHGPVAEPVPRTHVGAAAAPTQTGAAAAAPTHTPVAEPASPVPQSTGDVTLASVAAPTRDAGDPSPAPRDRPSPGAPRRASAAAVARFLAARQAPAAAAGATGLGGAEVRIPVRVDYTHADRPPTITLGERAAMFVGTCVVRELRALTFPRAAAGTVVDHTFTLRPGTSP